ncbi:MAG: addiction module toxin, HicA family [Acidobacteria bacterium RIFCSPLOWO2_02_FULL_67_36]|nr:MAG: addiction module toxin, HicA family [Acidobacteria bacterium RIFCSPLOWO2_02_FULL_67_36]OFW20734.1 MAG: addiction module toxin, HicA family [Acidobacteria bacterium RIFCSPLOWO2_12_FULL_66_21]
MLLWFSNLTCSSPEARINLVRHLEEHGCQLLREGGNHTIHVNRAAKKTSSVPRRNDINNDLAKKICKDLLVSQPDV